MKKSCFLFAVCLFPLFAAAQNTVIATGNWNSAGTWASGDIATTLAENVVMNDGFTVTVAGGDDFHVGSFTSGINNTLTIANLGNLELGDAGNPRDLVAGADMTINASGNLIIWGDLIVSSDNLIITIPGTGSIIVKGDLIVADFASFALNGDLTVEGSFTAGHDTNVVVGAGANIFVYGPTTVGIDSSIIGSGHFHTYGGCTGPATFCNTSPIELLFFNAEPQVTAVRLNWATGSELNFDYFIVERSLDGKSFSELGTVPGHGTSRERHDYFLDDQSPVFGKSYYRLTEVDFDKKVFRLKIVAVDFSGSKGVSIFPNPVTDGHVNLRLNFAPGSDVAVTIIDLRGVTLSEFTLDNPEVTLPINLDMGTYVVRVRTSDFSSVSRLVVR